MATKEIVIQAGEALPPPFESAFAEAFGPDALAKAQKCGAKLRLVITTPWPKAKREKKTIDQKYIGKLKVLAPDQTKLETEINTLSGPDILKVASLLEVPMSKSSKLSSLRAQLAKSLRSEIVWKSIAGQNDASADAQTIESVSNESARHKAGPTA